MFVRTLCQKGYTLIEVLVVVAVLSVAAMVAVPSFSSSDARYLDIAATEFADTLRFARSEAIRTGLAHGVNLDNSDTRFRVYRYNGTVDYSVYHPIDRQPFQIDFGTLRNPVTISSKAIKFEDLSVNFQSNISFAAGTGIPGSSSAGSNKLLEYANFVLEYGDHQHTVTLSAIGGQVTVQ